MKRAYVDISIEILNDFLHLNPGRAPGDSLLQSVEMSPGGERRLRLHLAGDALPKTYNDEPRRAWIEYEAIYDREYPYRSVRSTIIDLETADRPEGRAIIEDGTVSETAASIMRARLRGADPSPGSDGERENPNCCRLGFHH